MSNPDFNASISNGRGTNPLHTVVVSISVNKHPNIWDIPNNNIKFSLDILSENNAVKQVYHIQHIFNWFKGSKLFNICYILKKIVQYVLIQKLNIKN